MTCILSLEYCPDMGELIGLILNRAGYNLWASCNSYEAWALLHTLPFDLLIQDIMRVDMDGWEFQRLMRADERLDDVPIMFATSAAQKIAKGLAAAANVEIEGYITKPFGMREMLARIRAVLRRAEKTAPEPEILRASDVVLDKDRRSVTVGSTNVNLTPTEFDLLATLMAEPGRVFSRASLLEAVQGIAFEGLERSINVHIRNLRTKIEPDPGDPCYIETVFGVGYRFSADVGTSKPE